MERKENCIQKINICKKISALFEKEYIKLMSTKMVVIIYSEKILKNIKSKSLNRSLHKLVKMTNKDENSCRFVLNMLKLSAVQIGELICTSIWQKVL